METGSKIGKQFEREFREVLKELQRTKRVSFHRLSDSTAAGTVIADQPADYIIAGPGDMGGQMGFLELKASQAHSKLRKADVNSAQRGAIARFRESLGVPYYILFWDWCGGRLELWDGIHVIQEKNLNVKDRLAEWSNCGSMGKLRTAVVVAALIDHFKL